MSAVNTLLISEISVPAHHRAVDREAVSRIAASVETIGLQYPITVRNDGRRYLLIAGRHRLEALRSLGKDRIPASIVKMDDDEARMWEIVENLHRAELSALERAEQIAEYAELAKRARQGEKHAQVAQVSGGRGNQGGDSAAARDLGVKRDEVRRSAAIAKIDPEAKQAAADAGMADNQSALLKVAKEKSPAAQLAAVKKQKEAEQARKDNSARDRSVAYAEAQEFADWLMARLDLAEVDHFISCLLRVKPKDLASALRREAA